MGLFRKCKHEWVVLEKIVLPSAFEQVVEAAAQSKCAKVTTPPSMEGFYKVAMVVACCKKCGKIRK